MAKTAATSKTTAANPATKAETPHEGTKIGVVESAKRDKSRTVVMSYTDRHPKYGKYVSKRTVLQVHDEANTSALGDIVEVAQCRPMSKSKNWKLVRVVEKRSAAAAALASAAEIQ